MIVNARYMAVSLLYAVALCWIYVHEILVFWDYMGFVGGFSLVGFSGLIAATALSSLVSSRPKDARDYILVSMNFIFFIPSFVYISMSYSNFAHVAAQIVLVTGLVLISRVSVPAPALGQLSQRNVLAVVLASLLASVAVQALYGGLQYFSLDIDRVYEFRRAAAELLPPFFGYLYSNVATALVPAALILSILYGNKVFTATVIVSSVILFGMTQAKNVLFGPFIVLVLFLFYRRKPSAEAISLLFLAVAAISIAEIMIGVWLGAQEPSYFTSLVVRRVLFFPTMLDGLYIDYFSSNALYYWSSSRIGDLFVENPYGVTAPHVIGQEFFGDEDTSANTGIIGSGYANAGLLGVTLYTAASGLLLALFNQYGRRIGHAFVAATVVATMYNVITTTDFLTAILTHGVLLLIVLLASLVRSGQPEPSPVRYATA